jgi:hypothetical protein
MKDFIEKFKKLIRFAVTIFASREFAFIYCLIGTLSQLAHTYYLTESISSLEGNWKIIQAMLMSFFISSSLLYFVAIADGQDTKESKRINLAVNLFMIIEIAINFYYYSRHLLIDSAQIQIFDFIFAVVVSCLIPVTIKLYANTIKAKEWMEDMTKKNEVKNYGEVEDKLFDGEIDPKLEELIGYTVNQKIEHYRNDITGFAKETGLIDEVQIKQFIENKFFQMKKEFDELIDPEIAKIFEKNKNLFLKQFEDKCKFLMKTIEKEV